MKQSFLSLCSWKILNIVTYLAINVLNTKPERKATFKNGFKFSLYLDALYKYPKAEQLNTQKPGNSKITFCVKCSSFLNGETV